MQDPGYRYAVVTAAGPMPVPAARRPLEVLSRSGVPRMTRREVAAQNAGQDHAAELFAGQYPRLAGWCRRMVDDDDTAHEIAAEAFTRLLTRLSKVDDPVNYLYRIAANLVNDHWRRVRRDRDLLRRQLNERPAEPYVPDPGIRELVDALPKRLRVPVLLHYFADLSVREVSRVTGRPEGTVKSDLRKAREVLRKTLERHRAG